MQVDTSHIVFRIRRYQGQFALVVRYYGLTFVACKGYLAYIKPKFIKCVNNRDILVPLIKKVAHIKNIA